MCAICCHLDGAFIAQLSRRSWHFENFILSAFLEVCASMISCAVCYCTVSDVGVDRRMALQFRRRAELDETALG